MSFIKTLFIASGVLFAWCVVSSNVCRNNLSSKSIRNISIPVFAAIGIFTLLHFFTIIPAGHIGVIDLFGAVSKRTLPAGINWVNPFAGVTKFPIRPEESNEKMQVLSCEGFTIEMKMSVFYRLKPDSNTRVLSKEHMMNSYGLEKAHESNPYDIRVCYGCTHHAAGHSGGITLAIYEGDAIISPMITSSLYGTEEQNLSKVNEE